jgi:hypothetical protein
MPKNGILGAKKRNLKDFRNFSWFSTSYKKSRRTDPSPRSAKMIEL